MIHQLGEKEPAYVQLDSGLRRSGAAGAMRRDKKSKDESSDEQIDFDL